MKPDIEELRKKYIENPPEGMTSEDIRHMSEDDLLDMDYFLNEDDPFDDLFGEEGFISSNLTIVLLSFPRTCSPSSSLVNACFFYFLEKSEFPIKAQKSRSPAGTS